MTGLLWIWRPEAGTGAWLAMDPLGLVVLTVVSVLFLAVAVCTIGYSSTDRWWGGRAFVSCLLAFLAAATLVAVAHHFALIWIGMEATTLSLLGRSAA